jgi:hypothetical protein
MSQSPEKLSLSTLAGLFSVDGVYTLSYSFLFGSSIWITFFGGVIAYRALRTSQRAFINGHYIYFIFVPTSSRTVWCPATPNFPCILLLLGDRVYYPSHSLDTLSPRCLGELVQPYRRRCLSSMGTCERAPNPGRE